MDSLAKTLADNDLSKISVTPEISSILSSSDALQTLRETTRALSELSAGIGTFGSLDSIRETTRALSTLSAGIGTFGSLDSIRETTRALSKSFAGIGASTKVTTNEIASPIVTSAALASIRASTEAVSEVSLAISNSIGSALMPVSNRAFSDLSDALGNSLELTSLRAFSPEVPSALKGVDELTLGQKDVFASVGFSNAAFRDLSEAVMGVAELFRRNDSAIRTAFAGIRADTIASTFLDEGLSHLVQAADRNDQKVGDRWIELIISWFDEVLANPVPSRSEVLGVLSFAFAVWAILFPSFTETDRANLNSVKNEVETNNEILRRLEQAEAAAVKALLADQAEKRNLKSVPRGEMRRAGNIRKSASGSADIIIRLSPESPLAVVDKDGRWLHIAYVDPITQDRGFGWVWAGSVEIYH
ncbi:hypothetical protein GRI38_01745 [Altererythrobacter aurantiacus]|uniref:SH3 domain-containing protein n=1 Tax=Parapontixanthobacter aurantiacus TaxID=1463599 RepID=A0A844ZCN4_9SPHN|nr:hypothetical protein [Parapontixanthobacter aurantiacus]MXO84757.1 hypothetical protein [Parapontixanthobacter aurantiacus]